MTANSYFGCRQGAGCLSKCSQQAVRVTQPCSVAEGYSKRRVWTLVVLGRRVRGVREALRTCSGSAGREPLNEDGHA